MASSRTTLGIEITADNAKALKGLRQVEEGLKDVSGQAEKTSKKSSGLRDVLGGIAVGAGLKLAIGEFEEAQTSAAQTAAVIKSTGNAAEVTAAQQNAMADSLSKIAAVDDDVVNSGANVLRTFTAVKGEAFEPALAAALDLSAAMGTDLQSSVVLLGKALNDPAAGLSKLTRAGVTFTEGQKEQIRTLQESGDTLGAQKVILAEVEKEFGGSAAANATSTAKMKVAFGEAAESLGGALVPGLQTAAKAATVAGEAFDVLPGPIKGMAVAGAALALVGPKIAGGWDKAGTALGGLRTKSKQIEDGTASLTTKLQGAAVGTAALTGAVLSGVEAWQQWGQAGKDAAGSFLDQQAASAPKTADSYRELAKQSREYGKALNEQQSGGLASMTVDRDLNRSLQEGAGLAKSRADAYVDAANKIEEAAKSSGLSVQDVESIIESANLDPTTMSAKDLGEAIAKWGEESGAASPKARLSAEAAKKQAEAFTAATGAAHDLFNAQQGVGDAAKGVSDAQQGVTDAHKGVEAAERSLTDAHKGVADAAQGVREAQQSMADASEGVTTAQRDLASAQQDLASAQRDASQGTRELRDANDGVTDAEHNLAQAQRDSKQAQLDLTTARADAAEQLDDLGRSAEGAVLSEKEAILGLQEAKQRLADLGKPGKDGTPTEVTPQERARAALAVERAELGIRDAVDSREEAQARLADAEKKGIEGSDAVTAAKGRVVDAAGKEKDAEQAVADAKEHVTEVQEALAERVVAAQAKVVDAQGKVRDAQDKVTEASLRVRDAHDAVGAAQQRVSEASAGVVEARAQVAVAEDKVTDSLLAQIDARQVLDAQQIGNAGAVLQQIRRYEDLALTLDPASPLRQHLLQLATDLRNVSGVYDITFAIKSLGEDASPGAKNAERRLARGGDVAPGESVIVGDGGRPEVFTAGPTGGHVFPDASKFSGGGVTSTINVYGTVDPATVAEMVAARQGRDLRRMALV